MSLWWVRRNHIFVAILAKVYFAVGSGILIVLVQVFCASGMFLEQERYGSAWIFFVYNRTGLSILNRMEEVYVGSAWAETWRRVWGDGKKCSRTKFWNDIF